MVSLTHSVSKAVARPASLNRPVLCVTELSKKFGPDTTYLISENTFSAAYKVLTILNQNVNNLLYDKRS